MNGGELDKHLSLELGWIRRPEPVWLTLFRCVTFTHRVFVSRQTKFFACPFCQEIHGKLAIACDGMAVAKLPRARPRKSGSGKE